MTIMLIVTKCEVEVAYISLRVIFGDQIDPKENAIAGDKSTG